MKRVILQNTDLELSNVCYGTGNFGEKLSEEESFAVLDAFVLAGGNFIDTANVYCKWVPGLSNCSEQYIGKWLKERNAYHKVVIATKGGHYDFNAPGISRVNKKGILEDLEESLTSLGLDHIDFYWLHRDDENKPIGEIIDIMEDLKSKGKIRYYGASNYSLERMKEAKAYAKEKGIQGFSAVSNQWSMAKVNPGSNLNSDKSLVLMNEDYYQWHKESKMPIIPYSSSGNGYFQKRDKGIAMTEKLRDAYDNEINDENFKKLKELSKEKNESVFSLSIAWLLNQPFQVFPIVSVSKLEQLPDFIRASEIEMPKEEF
ncbi:aryl-alcohol dehydrogenase-like predicted oxidoreductase [Aequitasia blattaphilus]|uniref:Aldo/keto reductase n=1 Tax=Aequitasia blattaphilus TaxID=2949332 RepID=A0ABT1EBI7_9FIRM|nr:aldo/keto reductase [Aequitasia blattaphilus]MCP1102999.1 aldo/keto reductase [Aequitasia blattaphilus]MCR8615639.1 aldo/keto reductase [Aequitasia blattaphilus]